MPKIVMVFGTFDLLHQGHKAFLEKAATLADQCVAIVARDAHVRLLKKKEPLHAESERLECVKALPCVAKAALADEALGTYGVIREFEPDVIALGYDQQALKENVESWLRAQGRRILIVPIEHFVCPSTEHGSSSTSEPWLPTFKP